MLPGWNENSDLSDAPHVTRADGDDSLEGPGTGGLVTVAHSLD